MVQLSEIKYSRHCLRHLIYCLDSQFQLCRASRQNVIFMFTLLCPLPALPSQLLLLFVCCSFRVCAHLLCVLSFVCTRSLTLFCSFSSAFARQLLTVMTLKLKTAAPTFDRLTGEKREERGGQKKCTIICDLLGCCQFRVQLHPTMVSPSKVS